MLRQIALLVVIQLCAALLPPTAVHGQYPTSQFTQTEPAEYRLYLPHVNTAPVAQELIATALQEGRIDYVTSLRYRAYALFDLNALPSELRGVGSSGSDEDLFNELVQAHHTLPPELVRPLQPFLVRPTSPQSFFSRAIGAGASTTLQKTCLNGWESLKSDSDRYTIWARCDQENSLALGIVDLLMEQIWDPMTALMGDPYFDSGRPELGNVDGNIDGSIDIYLVDFNAPVRHDPGGESGTLQPGIAGATLPTAPFFTHSSSGYMLIGRHLLTDSITLRSVLVHEFFHILQYAHNGQVLVRSSPPCAAGQTCSPIYWFAEASAVWAEHYFAGPDDAARVLTRQQRVYPWFKAFQDSEDSLHAQDPSRRYMAYIWPFFMEQERGGPQVIAETWQALESVEPGDWDAATNVIDKQLPFAIHFRSFALRNLNDDFYGSKPVKPLYSDLDPTFPEGYGPNVYQDRVHFLRAVPRDYPPDEYGKSIKALSAQYVHFAVDDDRINQVIFDFTAVEPADGVDIDAVVKIAGRPWEVRKLPRKVTFCFDKADERLDEIYVVLSNHLTDVTRLAKGVFTVRPLKEQCSCGGRIGAVQQWRGNISYNYAHTAVGSSSRFTLHQQAAVTAILPELERGRTLNSYLGSTEGRAQVEFEERLLNTNDLISSVTGSGPPIPYDAAQNRHSRMGLVIRLDTCQYQFTASTEVEAVTEGGRRTEGKVGGVSVLRPLPTDSLTLSGSALLSGHTSTYIMLHGGDFFAPWYLESLAEEQQGQVVVTWSFEPVEQPPPPPAAELNRGR